MNKDTGVEGCGCNSHRTAATVRISTRKGTKKSNKAEIRKLQEVQAPAENGKEPKETA